MKILFAYDHKFCRDKNGNIYSTGQFPYRLWQRYLEIFDEIVVAGRVRELSPEEQFDKLDLSSGPRVSFVEMPNLNGPVDMTVNRGEAVKRIRAALLKCDALIARNGAIGWLAAEIAQQMKLPWALEIVGCPFDALWNHGAWQGKLLAPYAAYKTRQIAKLAPYALYVTKRYLQDRYPCNGRSVGCSDVQLIPSDEAVLIKRLMRIERGQIPFSIGLIGSLATAYKGVDIAIEALAKIKEQVPAFEFKILGAGNSEKWRKIAEQNGLKEQTVFCGTLTNGAAVNQWLDDIDLYIQPSLTEGLPRALVEAMNRGCPALGSSAGGIPELLDPGCIHEPGDVTMLSIMLEHAILDKRWQANQAARNFRSASAYDSTVLGDIRREFWLDFVRYCKEQKEMETETARFSSPIELRKVAH
jgi:glycosyltransferase involved in cell wall biosynthesis